MPRFLLRHDIGFSTWLASDSQPIANTTDRDRWPRISIVMPSYQQADYLDRAIKSVLLQNYPNLEFIVMDGGSTDGSQDIIKKHQNRLAHWTSHRDKGQSDALNQGFSKATGSILAYLNSDDFYLPFLPLHYVANFFLKHPTVDIVQGHSYLVDTCDRVIGCSVAIKFSIDDYCAGICSVSQPATFWRSEIMQRVGSFNVNNRISMDSDFFLEAAVKGASFARADRPLAAFRVHAGSTTMSGNHEAQRLLEFERVKKNYSTFVKTKRGGFVTRLNYGMQRYMLMLKHHPVLANHRYKPVI